MKKIASLIAFLILFTAHSFGKKDPEAWKREKTLNQQFEVFKSNLKYWNGSYFLNETQMNDFYNTLRDSVAVFEKEIEAGKGKILALQNELDAKVKETGEIQTKLTTSLNRENSVSVFGLYVNKNVYTAAAMFFILGVLIVAALIFLLYKRSNSITQKTKKDYNELKEEYEAHKKSALERYVKINTELTKLRLELNRRQNFTIE